ncbi:Crp/Fnr family transcriptional regulator [Segeticoccus rhizosphaerae]|uniref:Crp/Fnr family transcriptional regulator n=1 Tax=Segeticoccus rhizosphaerae TaxID=1104777 RepID=UPI001264CDEE|nr:Crp/Fnr family transcriptional regulator [Segeticoccus rhizosphaerae]
MTTSAIPTSSAARRRTPLAQTCGVPHACDDAVRMRVLSRVPYFAGLSRGQLEGIDRRMNSLSWADGDPLYLAGDPAEHLFVVAAGRVKVVQPTLTGQEVVVDMVGPGDLFGALSTLGEPVHTESAWALTTVCALRIDPDAFREVLVEHPQVALRVLDDVAGRLARSRVDVGQHSAGTVRQRVATTLLRLADKLGEPGEGGSGTLLQVPLSRTDLAGLTGSTPESVSRVMSRLRREGVIDTGRRWTAVLDRDRLALAAEDGGQTSTPLGRSRAGRPPQARCG